ncbi:glutaminase A [Eubacterium limosum]|uniref:Glutaminase n=1 Tax=Eubacterium limosum TaxID=1736 RepID=A0ABT5UM43_EUBLI|nr:glutaminase A [Eubacterium limosum]MCB6568217.1 glutaminase A [Eubacterium limosum]MDE1469996.1 glutaminase A [Eubacterium limosum]
MQKNIIDTKKLEAVLKQAHSAAESDQSGANASYIPALAKVPSNLFGLTAVTADGTVIETGDSSYPFAIESISKVFSMALVMEAVGAQEMLKKVGADPTGLPFNSVMALELHRGKPLSPLVNAGAMATVSLLPAASADEKWQKILDGYSQFAGHRLEVMDAVYTSETATNSHNKGIAWLMSSYGTLYDDPDTTCDIYTRQCSIAITCKDLAVMGSTLANGGVNPITGKAVINPEFLPHIFAEMTMEGLYGASGDFAYTVGLPGKSGVGGGLLAVVPGHLALSAFSPRLDPIGNSVRGQKALRFISDALDLSLYR